MRKSNIFPESIRLRTYTRKAWPLVWTGCLLWLAVMQTQAHSLPKDSLRMVLKGTLADSVRVKVLNQLSREYWISDLDSSMLLAMQGLKLAQALGSRQGIAESYFSIGGVYQVQEDDVRTMEYYLKALSIFQQTGDNRSLINCYNNIGMVYERQGNPDKALSYYQKAYRIIQKTHLTRTLPSVVTNLGNIYLRRKEYNKALPYARRALKLSQQAHQDESTAVALYNLGDIYTALEDYPQAISYLTKALHLSNQIQDSVGVAYCFQAFACVYYATGNTEQSFRYARQGAALSHKLGMLSVEHVCQQVLSDNYRKLRNFEQALFYRDKANALKDTLNSQQRQKAVAQLQNTYELAQKQLEIDLLNKNKIIQADKLRRQQLIRNGLIACLAVAIVLAGLFWYHLSHRKRLNTLLNQENEAIRFQKEEINQQKEQLRLLNATKDKIFSIISHDLLSPINSLQGMVWLLKDQDFTEEERILFTDKLSKQLDHTTGMLTNLLQWTRSQMGGMHPQMEKINFQAIIEQVLYVLQPQAQHKSIHIDNQITEPLWIEADRNMMEVVFRNLVSNAIKFTYPDGHIQIRSTIYADSVVISVQDTGQGIRSEDLHKLFSTETHFSTSGTAREKGTGLGLLLSKDFVEKNGGELFVESQEGKGSTFSFQVKK